MSRTSAETTVVCHVRAPLLLEPVDQQVETLNECENEGTIDTVLLRSWPKEVTISSESPYPEVLDAVDRFERWADRQGVSIYPPFRERTRSTLTEGTKDVLVTPMLCLAVYRGDELYGVFPHSDGEETYTATDTIATLRTGELPTPMGSPALESPEPDTCPECDGRLVNGQGVYVCRDCEWIGETMSDGQYVPVSLSPVTRPTRSPTLPET
ncbi:HTH domain-containing protein [Natrialbaceae archaeon AArc-T1-2]|uniref:HTH domain-containing protein n=1 Tax=Natrialbaceae archaeon AArc-T1-2 TaxID=3053904 RepID=UPI00255B3774|nr:HTH domain-containing protein [Natrialbaceae archaeon AArc-T1-2]WIV66914.1 hypothetical protein QQ977_14670 [Natrialbaceae archaeon AArc-T1-2]